MYGDSVNNRRVRAVCEIPARILENQMLCGMMAVMGLVACLRGRVTDFLPLYRWG